MMKVDHLDENGLLEFLEGDMRDAAYEYHVMGCPSCRRRLADLLVVFGGLRHAGPPAEVPAQPLDGTFLPSAKSPKGKVLIHVSADAFDSFFDAAYGEEPADHGFFRTAGHLLTCTECFSEFARLSRSLAPTTETLNKILEDIPAQTTQSKVGVLRILEDAGRFVLSFLPSTPPGAEIAFAAAVSENQQFEEISPPMLADQQESASPTRKDLEQQIDEIRKRQNVLLDTTRGMVSELIGTGEALLELQKRKLRDLRDIRIERDAPRNELFREIGRFEALLYKLHGSERGLYRAEADALEGVRRFREKLDALEHKREHLSNQLDTHIETHPSESDTVEVQLDGLVLTANISGRATERTLRGRILDSNTGQPASTAHVSLEDYAGFLSGEGETNSLGEFFVAFDPPASHLKILHEQRIWRIGLKFRSIADEEARAARKAEQARAEREAEEAQAEKLAKAAEKRQQQLVEYQAEQEALASRFRELSPVEQLRQFANSDEPFWKFNELLPEFTTDILEKLESADLDSLQERLRGAKRGRLKQLRKVLNSYLVSRRK